MDKEILRDYIDACELIKETEEDIRRLEKRRNTIVRGVVKGSMHEFPYAAQNFHVEGLPYSSVRESGNLEAEEQILKERKNRAERVKVQAETWMNTIPQRMQRIIRMKIFEEKTWREVAAMMGRKYTAESVKKEYQRFMEEK